MAHDGQRISFVEVPHAPALPAAEEAPSQFKVELRARSKAAPLSLFPRWGPGSAGSTAEKEAGDAGNGSGTDESDGCRAAPRSISWEDSLARDLQQMQQSGRSPGAAAKQIAGKNMVVVRPVQYDGPRDMQWLLKIVFGIGPAMGTIEASRLIHPYSLFSQCIAVCSSCFLLYTALVTPVILCFYSNTPPCWKNPFLDFDMVLDSFFLFEILVTFFVGVYSDGRYIDRWPLVVERYFKSGALLFDAVTSVPVSYLEFAAIQECGSADEPASGLCLVTIMNHTDSPSELRLLRMVKPLRLFKLLRIIRALKFTAVLDKVQSFLQLPLVVFRLTRLLIITFYIVHICSCIYWIVKEISYTEDDMSMFAVEHGLAEKTQAKYTLSIYFISSIFTTVGFGDIAATNEAEQVFCVFIMYMSTFIFGTLLSEVEFAVEAARAYVRAKGRVKQEMQGFLQSNGVSRQLNEKVLSWIEFNFEAQRDHFKYAECIGQMPRTLRLELLSKLHNQCLCSHSVFQALIGDKSNQFLDELYGAMTVQCFAEDEIIASNYQPSCRGWDEADRTYLIREGAADLCIRETRVITLEPGEYIGELCCLGESNWCYIDASLSFVATCSTVCLVLTHQDLAEVLKAYPNLQAELQEQVHKVRELRLVSGERIVSIPELSGLGGRDNRLSVSAQEPEVITPADASPAVGPGSSRPADAVKVALGPGYKIKRAGANRNFGRAKSTGTTVKIPEPITHQGSGVVGKYLSSPVLSPSESTERSEERGAPSEAGRLDDLQNQMRSMRHQVDAMMGVMERIHVLLEPGLPDTREPELLLSTRKAL